MMRSMRVSAMLGQRYLWTVELEGDAAAGGGGSKAEVELHTYYLTGLKQVLLDGEVVHETKKKTVDWTFEHPSKNRLVLRAEGGSYRLVCERPAAPAVRPAVPVRVQQP